MGEEEDQESRVCRLLPQVEAQWLSPGTGMGPETNSELPVAIGGEDQETGMCRLPPEGRLLIPLF